MSEHVSSLKLYIGIWITLLIGTVLTVVVAKIPLGPFNAVVALSIATIKATLVVLFFMHVKYSPRMIALVVGCGLFFLSILIVLSCSDYLTRRFST